MPRRKKPRPPQLDDIVKSDWDSILKEVDKKEVPIELLETVIVNFIDGSHVEINIVELLEEGMHPNQIEAKLNAKLESLDNIISDVDFHITKEKIISIVDFHTKKLLKKIG